MARRRKGPKGPSYGEVSPYNPDDIYDYGDVEDANDTVAATGVGGSLLPEIGDESISSDDPRNLNLASVETEGGGYGKKRVGKQSRGQMNLTGSRGSSILTS